MGNISSRLAYFANAIARNLAKTHPNRFLLTFLAYSGHYDPPDPLRRTEPGVCVMQVNEGNHVQPWDNMSEPPQVLAKPYSNTRDVSAFGGWQQTGGLKGIREWWIPGTDDPN